jgi:hypothetical protein
MVEVAIIILCTVLVILFINYKGDVIMSSIKELQTKVDELTAAEADREARDVAQDAVTQQQITLLQTTIDELRAIIEGGALSPENQAIVDASVVKLQATIDSLNAADPTAPVVP